MKANTAPTLFLAASIIGGVSCQPPIRDSSFRIPVVGVNPASTSSSIVSTSTSEAGSTTTSSAADEEELVKALEFDEHVTGKKEHYLCDVRIRRDRLYSQ